MNSKERLLNRMASKEVDRIPNLNIVMQLAAQCVGKKYGEYCSDYRVLAAGNLYCVEQFGIDLPSAISDPGREVSGMGAQVVIPEDGVPHVPVAPLQTTADLPKLRVVDPASSERMNDRMEAVRFMKERLGQDYLVMGWAEAPFAMANTLRGINELMMDVLCETEFVAELLEICLEQGVRFARAQIAAGADIIGIGDAAASLIGPKQYDIFGWPYEKRLIDAIHDAGAKAKLHICGNTQPLLPMMVKTGADIIDIDHMVVMKDAAEAFGTSCVCGNFDPVSIMLQGSEAQVAEAVRACVEDGGAHCIIAAGCEVPKDTPHANMRAVHKTLCEIGSR